MGASVNNKKVIAVCKNCGTLICGKKPIDQFTKTEIKLFFAIDKIKSEHPNWSTKKCYEEVRARRIYWSFMKWKKNHPEQVAELEKGLYTRNS